MSQRSKTESAAAPGPATRPAGTSLRLIPATLVSASGFTLFARENRLVGLILLAAALVLAGFISRRLLSTSRS